MNRIGPSSGHRCRTGSSGAGSSGAGGSGAGGGSSAVGPTFF